MVIDKVGVRQCDDSLLVVRSKLNRYDNAISKHVLHVVRTHGATITQISDLREMDKQGDDYKRDRERERQIDRERERERERERDRERQRETEREREREREKQRKRERE